MSRKIHLPKLEIKHIAPKTINFYRTQLSDDTKLPQIKNYDIAIDYYSKGIKNDKNNILFLIKRAICYLAKGFYTLALKDALKSIEIDPKFAKGYYIASLSYLEMYDIENAEKISKNKLKKTNQRLHFLIEKTKKSIKNKCMTYKLYPKYLYFLKELYKYDSYFPKLEIEFYSDNNRGVIAKNNIKSNEIIMKIPVSCIISLETALQTPTGEKIGKFMYDELNSPKHCLLSVYLLENEKNEKWKFYFDLLPKDFSNFPIFYNEKELEMLKGSPFLHQIYEKKVEMKLDYEKICKNIPTFTEYSYLKFMKARMLISSRIFGITINNNNTDVLVPFADLLNHKRPKQTQWYYDDNLSSFIIQAVDNINKGEEIFDSYGIKTNAKFLMNYGFALEDNDSNEYPLSIIFDKNVPLYDIKKKFIENEKDSFVKIFTLNTNIDESDFYELLSFLRFILFEDDPELLYNAINTDISYLYDTIAIAYFYVSPINKELEIKVIKYLLYLCKQALKQYPTTYEEDKLNVKNNKNLTFNMKNCIYLVMSEKLVLNYYIQFCEYCLSLFKMTEVQAITKITNDFKYQPQYDFEFYIKEILLKLIGSNM